METENELHEMSTVKTKKAYEAPVLEIVEVKVEQGVRMDDPNTDPPTNSDPTLP